MRTDRYGQEEQASQDNLFTLADALQLWLGPLLPNAESDTIEPPVRAMYLGAGYTKSANRAAPLFGDYVDSLCQRLREHTELPAATRSFLDLKGWPDVTDLIELLHDLEGRRAVIETMLTEPSRKGTFAIEPERFSPFCRTLPPRAESVYRTLNQWQEIIGEYQPTHLSPLHPAGPVVMTGRLVAEHWVNQVLTTNWDAYAELGCWLAGLRLPDRIDQTAPVAGADEQRQCVQVFDSPRQVALHPRLAGHPLLFKLHGGVGHITRIMHQAAQGWLTAEETDKLLSEAFLVSASDLTHWRDASQWVQDAVADTLRTAHVLFLGVSGADTVTFRVVRARIKEWERQRREWDKEHLSGVSDGGQPLPGPAPLVAANRDLRPRLASMLAIRGPRGAARFQLVRGDGRIVLRSAYAWALGQFLLSKLDPYIPAQRHIRDKLASRLHSETASQHAGTPLTDLLCDGLGPLARWAAIAERRPPFGVPPLAPESRWWYAPWSAAPNGFPPACRENLVEIAACAVALTPEADKIQVDPWTGAVYLAESHPLMERFREQFNINCDLLDLLLLPWPWPARRGLRSRALLSALRTQLRWGPGRSLRRLASPCKWIVPLPATSLSSSLEQDHLYSGLYVSGAWIPIMYDINWMGEASI